MKREENHAHITITVLSMYLISTFELEIIHSVELLGH